MGQTPKSHRTPNKRQQRDQQTRARGMASRLCVRRLHWLLLCVPVASNVHASPKTSIRRNGTEGVQFYDQVQLVAAEPCIQLSHSAYISSNQHLMGHSSLPIRQRRDLIRIACVRGLYAWVRCLISGLPQRLSPRRQRLLYILTAVNPSLAVLTNNYKTRV